MQGYVYVLSNPSYPSKIKVGMTTRTPEERALELSASTGVPTPFIVAHYQTFDDASWAENLVHTILESLDKRVSKNREFFSVTVQQAIDAINLVKSNETHTNSENINDADNQRLTLAHEQLELAEQCINAEETGFYDFEEAINRANKAKALGLWHQGHEMLIDIHEAFLLHNQ